MLDVVECWHWLLSACPTQELVFLQEMVAAWHAARAARLGLFTLDMEEVEEDGDQFTSVFTTLTMQMQQNRQKQMSATCR